MKTIKLTCYVQVADDATGVDPAIAALMTGNLKLVIVEIKHKDYAKLKGIEYRYGQYFKEPPKPKQEGLFDESNNPA